MNRKIPEYVTEWEYWLIRNGHKVNTPNYDKIAELCIEKFNLSKRSRLQSLVDMRHCLVEWWMENRRKFKIHKTYYELGSLMSLDHSSIVHYRNRKRSWDYDDNTADLRSFINSNLE